MRARTVGIVGAALFLALLARPAAVRADPVDLLEQDSQVFVQADGSVDVIYRLTFRENEGRSAIRQMGPFYEPVHFTRALFQGPGGREVMATTSEAGGGYYRIDFSGMPARAGQTYTIELHYRCRHRFADPTSRDGQDLLAVWFNPIRWTMPVG